MRIQDHLLRGKSIACQDTPNRGGLIEPLYLVFHFTAGSSAQSSADWLCNPRAKASAHVVLGRDGSLWQLAPFNAKTWHAGTSHWDGFSGLNSRSIGIELDNAGRLSKAGSVYRSWFQAEYPESEVILARHKHEQASDYWHAYTRAQIEKAFDLALLLVEEYSLRDILGHDDIAPRRKSDPGPAFPLSNLRARLFGRSEEEDEAYEVTADFLNIRLGPGIGYAKAGPALSKGTRLSILERRDRWSLVDVQDSEDTEGWVANRFIAPC